MSTQGIWGVEAWGTQTCIINELWMFIILPNYERLTPDSE